MSWPRAISIFYKQPSPWEGHEESLRRLNDLYYFDVLRVDRTASAHGYVQRLWFLSQFPSLESAHFLPIYVYDMSLFRTAYTHVYDLYASN